MLNRLKVEWRELKDAPAGTRFVAHYERHQARDAPYLKAMRFFATVFAAGMAALLLIVPGPSLPFLLLALVLLPAESRSLAELYDRAELYVRRIYGRGHAPAAQADAWTELETAPTQPVPTRIAMPAHPAAPQSVDTQPMRPTAPESEGGLSQPSAAGASASPPSIVDAAHSTPAPAPAAGTIVTPPPAASASRPAPTPRQHAAGTMKIWTSDLPAAPALQRPSDTGPKSTLLLFPPPPERDSSERSGR